jgi:hypothetical protein
MIRGDVSMTPSEKSGLESLTDVVSLAIDVI